MSFESLQALLAASGYEVRFRENEWVECLLVHEEEEWLGRGFDRAAALRAAVLLACPSTLARQLLSARLGQVGGEIFERAEVLDVGGSSERGSGPSLPVSSGGEAPASSNGVHAKASEWSAPARMPGGERRPFISRSSSMPALVRRDAVYVRSDPLRALEELDLLFDRIRDSREELGLCSPERQRLAILAWICEARAHTDSFPEDVRIRDRVGVISRQLTEIGKTFWPGSVTALQLQMQPRDLPRHVLGSLAPTWSRAAELAERALHSVEYADERRGFDAYGWADAPQTLPPPQNPGELMKELVAEIEAFAGALTPHASPRETDTRPPPESYRKWVRTLRWLRFADIDVDRWARIAGRLRWWATHRDALLSAPSRELEANYVPQRPWVEEVGGAPAEEGNPVSLLPETLEIIRDLTAGKRLVFVSTRRDPDLEQRLKDVFPGATLEWRVAEPRRLESLAEAIQQHAYDVVLAATGFQSLATDHLLARACKGSGVRYLRVNRGSPRACVRALVREVPASNG